MSNKVQDIGKRNHAHCFLDNISNIKNFDPNNIKKDEKSNKNIVFTTLDLRGSKI